MFYIYLLKSDEDKDLYIGFTNNLDRGPVAKLFSSGNGPETSTRAMEQNSKNAQRRDSVGESEGILQQAHRRVKEHNNGFVPSTKLRRPFELIYCEGYKSEKNARKREGNLKLRSRAFAQLKKRIIDSLE